MGLEPLLDIAALLELQQSVPQVHLADALLDYVQALIAFTRNSGLFSAGLSPRAGMALVRAAQAWALLNGHAGVHPGDVRAVLGAVCVHRLEPAPQANIARRDAGAAILDAVPVP
jgi:MoxR-like ATPase